LAAPASGILPHARGARATHASRAPLPRPTMAEPIATVNSLIARYPATVAVFSRFGIDTCSGGAVSVREAARRDGADPDALIVALADVLGRVDAERAGAGA
jgi:hypothetical protein